jgi:hypothetical protein
LKIEKARDAADVKLEQLDLKLARENFRINYYNTRVNSKADATGGTHFEWNGATKGCIEGTVPDSIQQKVENRINFFRVAAGVPPIYLDSQLNNWCQQAALVMESNNRLNHDLPETWTCYTPEAAEAATYSLLTQNATTTMAITSFVADQTHPSIGNRRWMLYPFSMVWGHGSTKSKCVVWALDDSRMKDTTLYKTQFVSWPGVGYTNRMLLFKKWSFSLYDSLNNAQVTMTLNKLPVKLVLEKPVYGYGLPTLVWTPELDIAKLKEGDKIEVVVKLKNNKTYNYSVKIFDFKP